MAEEEKKTYKDASKLQGGTPSAQYKAGSNIGGLDIITPYGNTISGSLKDNNAIETTPSDIQSARIGDYYLTSKGIAKLVPNSATDIDRKLRAIYGASPKQGLKPTDYANAALTAGAAFLGLPTDQSNLASTAGTFLAGKAAGGHPLTKTVWTIYSFFKSLNDAENRYLDDFSNQMVDIKPAYHIEERDGRRYAIIDQDVAASAGYGSGSLLTDITDYDKNKERTNVTLENGMLNINASSLYLNSDRYANLIDTIKSAYPDGITEEEANRVTDEDGESKTMLERIKDYVVEDEAQFYYKAKSIKMFKQLAPDASSLALNEACDTQTIGYMDTKTLEGTDVTIYDSDNNKKEVNALEYLRTIRDMSDEERNNYMAELGNRVLSDDISDDEKVVLRAQANALYAASSQESGEFKDMYKKDFGDSIADVSLPVIGRIGNWYGADELDTFETNEFYASGLTLAVGIPNLLIMKKIMGANEAGIRKGVSALGSKTGIGFLENINKFAPSNGHYVMNLVAGDLMNNIKELARRGLSDLSKFTIDAAADLGYDAVTAVAHGISGQDFNFKEEFWRDLYLDAIMTAGPQEFVKFAEMDKTTLKKIDGEVKFVKQSADELRAKRSKISTDLTASNAAMSTLRSFFDANFVILRNAVRTGAFTKGDSVEQQKLIRLSADVEQVASGELSKFMVSNKEIAQHFMDYNKALSDVAPKPKNYTKADRNYINAAANQHRFEQMAKGDRSATIAVHKKYKEALNGVSKERAEQLDTLLNSMRTICGDLLDFYKERGLISKETYETFKNHPAYKDNMFFPVWVKDKKYTAKDIVPQERKALKEVLDPKDLLDVDTFEDPLVTFSLYMNAVMRNVASNERKLAAIEAGLIAGMETRVTKDTGGHLAEYENLKKYSDQFKGKYDRIVREVKKEVPTLEAYKQDNEDAVQRSGAFKNIEQLKVLQDEGRELRNRLRREQRALEKAQKGEIEGVENDAIDNAKSSAVTIRNNGGKAYTDYGISAYEGRYFEAENPKTLYENSVKTSEQEEALRYYTAYNQLNSYLRNPESVTPKVEEWLDKKVKALDSAISGELSQNTVVYRAMGDDLYKTIGDSPVFENPGYTSATLNPEVVSDSLGDMVRLTVDEGTKALYIGDKTANIGVGKMKDEQEILFPRNMTVVITRDYSKLTPLQRDELGLPDKVKYDGILVPKSKAKKYENLKIEDFGGSAPKDKIKESLSKSGEKADSLFDFLVPTEEELSGLSDNIADRYNKKSANEKLSMLPDDFGWKVIDFINSSLGERITAPTVDDFKRAVATNPEGYARLNATFAAEMEKRASDTATKELSSKYPAFDVYGAVKSAARGNSMLNPLNEVPGSFGSDRYSSLADYYNQGFRRAAVLEMSPDEYLREIGNGRNSEGWEAFIDSDNVERYKRMSARGSKSPLMSITYGSEGGYEEQEGRHRALMAEALGYKKIPVIIKYDARTTPDALTKYTDITDDFKRAVAESQGYTYDVEGNIVKDAPREEFDVEARAESLLKQDRAQTPVERTLADIDQTRQEIVMNKQEQMKVVNDLPRLTKNLMRRQQAKNKWSPVVLDVDSYLNIQFVNDVREALKQNNSYANLYTAISRAVTRANPYVSQEDVIDKRAGEEAVKFRKKLSKDLPGQGETKVDTMLNKILEKFNVKPKVYDKDRGVVHYWMDGKIETVTFEGPGASFLAEALNAPDFAPPRTTTEMLREKGRGIGRKFARTKRTLTSAVDYVSAIRNIPRDISRGTVTTGGQILLSPKELETEAKGYWKDSPEAIEKIERGWRLAREAMKGSTFAQSLEVPKRNRAKSMIVAAHSATAPNGFVRFIWDFKNKTIAGKASTLNDAAEHFTRYRVSDVTYYRTLAQESAKGATIDEAINAAMEASYFNGKEATTNFARRGTFIGRVAENVPYLSQKFSSIQSLYLEWVNNPIAFTRSLRSFIFAYSALITITLSNEESRKRYFLLTDYDRANNVIIPLDNGMIITIPLDENLAAFATAWRRGIETLNGVDPEAFYLWGAEFLAALSPLDFTGFSEGDKFNIERGFQKLGNEMLPTWVLPLLENAQGRNFYYGTNIKVDEEYTEQYYDNPNPTPGEMTTRGKNSKTLAALSNLTGIPQWKLQNLLETYGGTVGQYALNSLDKIQGATVEEQGGKEFKDAIFKPFTGADSNAARDALWEGIERLNDEKAKLKKELKGIDNKIEASTGDEKAKLQEERQKKIDDYGTRVADFVSQYMSAYEITGGLSKKDANRIWYLYDIHGDADNAGTYLDDSYESYLNNKIRKQKNKHTTNLAAGFGLDQFIDRSKWVSDYNDTYAKQAFENSIYGQGYQTMAKIAKVFEDTSDYNNSLAKLRNDAYEARKKAYAANNYDLADAIAYEYDYKILSAALPYLEDAGLEQSLNNSTVMDYLKDWIMVPSEEMKAANGRYLSRLPSETEKSEAFKKRFIKKMYGVLEDE